MNIGEENCFAEIIVAELSFGEMDVEFQNVYCLIHWLELHSYGSFGGNVSYDFNDTS